MNSSKQDDSYAGEATAYLTVAVRLRDGEEAGDLAELLRPRVCEAVLAAIHPEADGAEVFTEIERVPDSPVAQRYEDLRTQGDGR